MLCRIFGIVCNELLLKLELMYLEMVFFVFFSLVLDFFIIVEWVLLICFGEIYCLFVFLLLLIVVEGLCVIFCNVVFIYNSVLVIFISLLLFGVFWFFIMWLMVLICFVIIWCGFFIFSIVRVFDICFRVGMIVCNFWVL